MDAAPRSVIQRVLHHSNDFDVELGAGTAAPTEMPADRALVFEEMLGELAIDDGDLGVPDDVTAIEIAAFQQRNSHRLEISRR